LKCLKCNGFPIFKIRSALRVEQIEIEKTHVKEQSKCVKDFKIIKKMDDKLFLNNDMDYEASDSDNEYTEREKKLLNKVRKGRKGNGSEEEEVFGFDEDDDSEPEKFEADSDFEDEGDDNDGLPNERAWGRKKSSFYNSDFQDQDYRNYTEKEEEAANLEQIEALQIQKRLANELNETDFNLDMFVLPETQAEDVTEEKTKVKRTKTDLSDLSKKQKIALFKSEAPEFDGLVQDFEERFSESKNLLIPTIHLMKSIEFPIHPFLDFIKCRNELILNYCTNISFYLMLKAKRSKVKNHPVVKRIIQFRQLICQLDDIFEYVVKPQIETLLAEVGDISSIEIKKDSSKLKILESLKLRLESAAGSEGSSENGEEFDKPLFTHKYSSESEGEEDEKEGDETMEVDEETGSTKRKITKQIAKNKGLTAKKRKELRNPRVKNKLKYKKAAVRRKGAIREVRSKVDLYGGEATGVKTHVKRGIKFK
jgi:U3 small nucleolar RNA-associated protein 3